MKKLLFITWSISYKLLKNRYDCVIACNHNAPSYFASYMNNTPKVVWIRGDMSELNYNNFNPTTVEYSGIKQEYNMQKNVLKTFDNIVVISEVVKKALKNNYFNRCWNCKRINRKI